VIVVTTTNRRRRRRLLSTEESLEGKEFIKIIRMSEMGVTTTMSKNSLSNGKGEEGPSNTLSNLSNGDVVCVSKVVVSSKTIPSAEEPTVVITNGKGGEDKDESPTGDEIDDELSKLNCEPLPGSALVRQKSATLTGGDGSGASSSSPSRHQRNSSPNAFMNSARNNLRRSFTLPRGLLLRKSGQTGPASENQNGNFVRNIFLTLVRSKSVRKKKGAAAENGGGSGEGLINGDEKKDLAMLPNKLQGIMEVLRDP